MYKNILNNVLASYIIIKLDCINNIAVANYTQTKKYIRSFNTHNLTLKLD